MNWEEGEGSQSLRCEEDHILHAVDTVFLPFPSLNPLRFCSSPLAPLPS